MNFCGHSLRQSPIEVRLAARIKCNGECREFLGAGTRDGYAMIVYQGKKVSVHRLVWELANGPIPGGMQVLHRCDNRRCGRTSHFFLGTNYDNVQDKVRKNRQFRLKGEDHPHHKLTYENSLEIKALWATGQFTRKQIAVRYRVSPGLIGHVVKGRNWKERSYAIG